MSTRVDYTTDEWQLLRSAPVLAGFAVIAADEHGPIGTLKEVVSLARGYTAAERQYPDNQLIQRVVQSLADEDGVADESAGPEEPLAAALASCRGVSDLLTLKATPQAAEQYKRWVLDVALRTARAAKEGGGLFGIGGTRVSPAEVTTLDMLAGTLGITWSPNPTDTRPSSPWRALALVGAAVLALGGIALVALAVSRAGKSGTRSRQGARWRARR
jgi:hypothetical protein